MRNLFFIFYFIVLTFVVNGETKKDIQKEIIREDQKIQRLRTDLEKSSDILSKKEDSNLRLNENIIEQQKQLSDKKEIHEEKLEEIEDLQESLARIKREKKLTKEIEARYQRNNIYYNFDIGGNVGDFTGSNFSILKHSQKFFLNTEISMGYKFWYLIIYGTFLFKQLFLIGH